MKPKEIVRLYKILCVQCRYNWVYNNKAPDCNICENKRFYEEELFSLHTLNIKIYEDFETDTFHLNILHRRYFNKKHAKSRALLIFTSKLPAKKELFDTFIHRSDFIFGRFFTAERFIGTSIAKYDLFSTWLYIFTL